MTRRLHCSSSSGNLFRKESECKISQHFTKGGFRDPFYAPVLFLYCLKTPESQKLSDVFRGEQKQTNGTNKVIYNQQVFALKIFFDRDF